MNLEFDLPPDSIVDVALSVSITKKISRVATLRENIPEA